MIVENIGEAYRPYTDRTDLEAFVQDLGMEVLQSIEDIQYDPKWLQRLEKNQALSKPMLKQLKKIEDVWKEMCQSPDE